MAKNSLFLPPICTIFGPVLDGMRPGQPAKSVLRLRPTFAIFIPVEFNKPHMKRFLLAACMLLAAVGFSSCENDDDDLYDTLTGRVWAGDLGFYQDGYALDSYVYFGADGFGSDELRYADNLDACSHTGSTSSGTPTTTRSTSTTAGSICRANCAGSTSAAAC